MLNSHLLKAVSAGLRVDGEAVNLETSQANTAAWDSLAHLRLILDLEAEFGVRFTTAEIPHLTSVAAIRDSLIQHGCQ